MSHPVHPAIISALENIPPAIGVRSGSVFYSGRSAFTHSSPLYLLGLNPGGSPERQAAETTNAHIEQFHAERGDWSAYADECWEGRAAGTYGMQPRVLHLLAQLELDPRKVPSSNVVFVRSRDERAIKAEKKRLLSACWPVHAAVIASLNVRVLVCFGGTCGRWAREQLGAYELVDNFKERNRRGWTSKVHQAPDGRMVATLTHPSRADWTNSNADPTPMIARALALGAG